MPGGHRVGVCSQLPHGSPALHTSSHARQPCSAVGQSACTCGPAQRVQPPGQCQDKAEMLLHGAGRLS